MSLFKDDAGSFEKNQTPCAPQSAPSQCPYLSDSLSDILSDSLSDISCGYEVCRLEEGEDSENEESDASISDESTYESSEEEGNDENGPGNPVGENAADDPDDPDDPGEPANPNGGVEADNANQDGPTEHFAFDDPTLNISCRIHQNITVREIFVLVLTLSVRYCLTYDCIIDIFKVINTILGRDYLPKSKKKMRKILRRNNMGVEEHAYCPRCLREILNFEGRPARFQCQCHFWISKARAPVFVKLSIKKQFKFFLERGRLAEFLRYEAERQKKVPDNTEDLLDGSLYKSLQEPGQVLSDPDTNSYVLNSDGLKVAKSSGAQAWPIFVRPNEIHPLIRQKFIFLAGVWVDRKEPNMNMFFKPFVEEANEVSTQGIAWTSNGEEKRSRFVPVACTADAKGRCAILNANEPTGYHACLFCDHQGVQAGGTPKYPIWPCEHAPDLPEPVPRTYESIIHDMIAAQTAVPRRTVNGFKGFSELANLEHFDLKQSFSTDDLHPIYLGVFKDYFKELLTADNDCYIGDPTDVARINRRVMSLKTPTCLARKPRPIETWKRWTGTELRNALFYELPCLEGILVARYIRHLKLLANATFLLSQDSISEEDFFLAEENLLEFCVEFEDIFGVDKMKFNVHMLLHLVEICRILDNLWSHTTFNFQLESPNQKICHLIKCSV